MPVLAYIVVAVAAYLLGSIPTGFLVAKAKGIDIRSVGSGNIGATNAMRVLGKPAGIFVLLMDALKGYVACRFDSAIDLRIVLMFHYCPDIVSIISTTHRKSNEICIHRRNFRRARPQLHLLAEIQRRQRHRDDGGSLSRARAVGVADRAGGFHFSDFADAICFRRFNCGGGCVAGCSLDHDAAEFISRHRHDGARRAGDLQTQIQHPTTHGGNGKSARQKTSTSEDAK